MEIFITICLVGAVVLTLYIISVRRKNKKKKLILAKQQAINEHNRQQVERAKKKAIEQAEREKQQAEREKQKALAEQKRLLKEEQERQQLEQQKIRQAAQVKEQAERKKQAEQEKKRKEQKALQEKRDAYKYFTSDPQCKLAIGNFVNQNSNIIDNIILDVRMEQLSSEISKTEKYIKSISNEASSAELFASRATERRASSISRAIATTEEYIEKLSEEVAKLTKIYRAALRDEEKLIAEYNTYHVISQNATAWRLNAENELKGPKDRLKTQKELLKAKKKELRDLQKESQKEQKVESLKGQKEILEKQQELAKLQEEYGILKSSVDAFNELVSMLTKALNKNTKFTLGIAKAAIHQAIITTSLCQWKTDFEERYQEFCEKINPSSESEKIKMFAGNFSKEKTSQKTVFSFFLLLYNVTPNLNTNLSALRKKQQTFENKLNQARETVVYENFKSALFAHIDTNKDGESFTIYDIDGMDGTQFEQYIAKLFEKMGYETEVTKHSGDQGIDVLAKNDIVTIGIQAKCYSGTVGNSAVQEAVGGRALYKVDKVMVITNNKFTPAAKQLAKANNVELWDRNKLKEKVDQYEN